MRKTAKRRHSPTLEEKQFAKFALLRGIGRAELARLARAARPRELATREIYVRHGSAVPGFCFLTSGSVMLWLGRGPTKRVFRVIAAGESFCEAPALARATSPFEIRALKKTSVLAVPAQEIEALAARNSRFSRALVALLAERVMLALGDLDASTLPATGRLSLYLASVAEPTASGAWHAALPVSKTVLAARLGMKKETLSRALRALSDEGLITVARRNLIIRDPKRLLAGG